MKKIKSNKLFLIEIFVIVSLTVLFGFWLHNHMGYSRSIDDLHYLDLGLNNKLEPAVMNRYFHIYLQKFFLVFVDIPIEATRLYWSFIFTMTVTSLYAASRLLYKSVFPALLTIGIFLAQTEIFNSAGTTDVDFTLMLMLMILVVISLAYIKTNHNIWLVLFGLFFYFSIKTKEPGLAAIILIPVFIFSDIFELKIRLIIKKLLLLLAGILLGQVFFFILDFVILGDPWFSIRFSNVQQLMDFNLGAQERHKGSYFDLILDNLELYVPFVLYLISLFDSKLKNEDKFIRFLPLFYIALLSGLMIFSRSSFRYRYLFPLYPLIALLSIHPIIVRFSSEKKQQKTTLEFIRLGFFLVSILSVSILFNPILQVLARNRGWDEILFFSNILLPIAITFLLGWILFFPQKSVRFEFAKEFIAIFLLVFIFIGFVNNTMINMIHSNKSKTDTFSRFSKMLSVKSGFLCHETDKLFLSEGVTEMFLYDFSRPSVSARMFNLSYGCNYTAENFSYGNTFFEEKNPEFEHIIISPEEWEEITKASPTWLEEYSLKTGDFVLLSRNDE